MLQAKALSQSIVTYRDYSVLQFATLFLILWFLKYSSMNQYARSVFNHKYDAVVIPVCSPVGLGIRSEPTA
jgi:hypothetical protein